MTFAEAQKFLHCPPRKPVCFPVDPGRTVTTDAALYAAHKVGEARAALVDAMCGMAISCMAAMVILIAAIALVASH